MAHAAPTPGGPARYTTPIARGRTPGTGHRPPDVFDARTHRMARLVLPAVAGLVYGYWAAANRRFGGPLTVWNILFGLVTALVFALLTTALLSVAPRLRRELRALLWGAFTGCAVGFLYSQSNASVLRSAVVSLFVAAGTFVMLFYRFYSHQDASDRRVR